MTTEGIKKAAVSGGKRTRFKGEDGDKLEMIANRIGTCFIVWGDYFKRPPSVTRVHHKEEQA